MIWTTLTRTAGFATATLLLAGCKQDPPLPRPTTTVAVVTTRMADYAPVISLTGEIGARVSSDLSFTQTGRVVERMVDVGDHVQKGRVLATIDAIQQQASQTASQAAVRSAEAQLRQTSAAFERQKSLIGPGFTTRREYDQAEEAFRAAQGTLDVARAQLGTSLDQLGNTVLRATADGIITGRNIEAGQVVQAAQPVYTLAVDGPRDAVFNVYEAIFIQDPDGHDIRISLVSDPRVQAMSQPREVSPLVDPTAGTVRVKCAIQDAPPEMTLGAAVTGQGHETPRQRVVLPWTALSSRNGKPAVWVVDPASKKVSLQDIEIDAYEADRTVVRRGVGPGQIVVTRGQQFLHAGEAVDTIEEPAS